MKQYMFLLFFICTVLIFSACSSSDKYRLSGSVFIHDKDFPELPKYSEWGYNTFGTYIDRTPFVSDNYTMPVKIIVESDTCRIGFSGQYLNKATLTFHLPHFTPENYSALSALNNKTISLMEPSCMVTFTNNNKTDTLNITEGSLTFKRVQKLLVDKEEMKSVLSGTFSMKTSIAGEPVTIGNGRFDVTVGEVNFFKKR
ncbi:hypothetical protein SDC9_87706 [bioreactor metagenome]|uniref:Uncharacterized protein n=1 Tax=bioreactor metagenome TaxID=1076179 RepID=A0A644ZK00_9ZZZZ